MTADMYQFERSRPTKKEEWVDFKRLEGVQLDCKMSPFSTQILMTDCEKHRITVKSQANGRGEEKDSTGENSERLIERRELKTTLCGTDTGTLDAGGVKQNE